MTYVILRANVQLNQVASSASVAVRSNRQMKLFEVDFFLGEKSSSFSKYRCVPLNKNHSQRLMQEIILKLQSE